MNNPEKIPQANQSNNGASLKALSPNGSSANPKSSFWPGAVQAMDEVSRLPKRDVEVTMHLAIEQITTSWHHPELTFQAFFGEVPHESSFEKLNLEEALEIIDSANLGDTINDRFSHDYSRKKPLRKGIKVFAEGYVVQWDFGDKKSEQELTIFHRKPVPDELLNQLQALVSVKGGAKVQLIRNHPRIGYMLDEFEFQKSR